jgi:putative ABC transport system permease protein
VGVNNIVITPISKQKEEQLKEQKKQPNKQEQKKYSPGLTFKDLESFQQIFTCINKICPEIMIESNFIRDGFSRTGKLVGVSIDYFDISNFTFDAGSNFNAHQIEYGEQVCIIGKSIQSKFFSKEDPIGKYIKCGPVWLKVIGVLNERVISKTSMSNLGIRDYNMDIYTPIKTVLIRYKNRSLVTKSIIQKAMSNDDENATPAAKESYHQLDRIVIQVRNTEDMAPAAEVISRTLKRRHFDVVDFEITIPEMLLKQQQRTKDIFNIVLSAIAGISLLVGGIGIMNIMLASVLERIKEIGIRMSLGAKKTDIVQQFLFESTLISMSGGIVGVIVGIILTVTIAKAAGILTIISWWSVGISFGVSMLVGLVFGITPARRAAEQDPITCLRYE